MTGAASNAASIDAEQLSNALEQVKTATALVNQLISENALRDCTDPAVLEFAITMSQVRELPSPDSPHVNRVNVRACAANRGSIRVRN